MLPLNRFDAFRTDNKLFDLSDRILLAVSGGKDSVLMCQFFNASGIEFGISHCNFKLRDIDADLDETFVKDLAKQFNVPFHSTSFDTRGYSIEQHVSVQMAARDLRYKWLEEIRIANNYDFIAVAQHKNDAVETILLNLVRGTGISGLHGIRAKLNLIVRPLLFLSRDEIDELIEIEGISYREDSSNASVKYARNKIRIEVIPKLKELNPALVETFESNLRHFAGIEQFFKEQIDGLRITLFQEKEDYSIIDINSLLNFSHQQVVIYELFRPFHFTQNVLEDLIKSCYGISGKIFESASHTILVDRGKLILQARQKAELNSILLYEDNSFAIWGSYHFSWQGLALKDVQIKSDSNLAYFDARGISFPLTLRSWIKGDTFVPLGMKGRKKVSDFFISKKVPLTAKQHIPILENGNGDILWIAGFQTDDRYKVSLQSEKVIIFEMHK
jgi:tRNA(Ile)-lysidine synthase